MLRWKVTDTSKHFTYFFSDASQNIVVINFKHILVVELLLFSTSFILNHFNPVWHYWSFSFHEISSSHRRCSIKIDVLKNFTKFTEKRLCRIRLFEEVEGRRPASLLRKRLRYSCFPVNFAKFSIASIL